MSKAITFLIFCVALVCTIINASLAQVRTEIIVNVENPKVTSAVLEPFATFPIYTYTFAQFDVHGQAILQMDLDKPMMAELKIKEKNGQHVNHLPVYLEPGTHLTVTLKKEATGFRCSAEFQGVLSEENKDLQKIQTQIYLLTATNSPSFNPEQSRKEIMKTLDTKSYVSEFKILIKNITELILREHRLTSLERDQKAYKKDLQEILQAIQDENAWLSIFEWPRLLDKIFSRCETIGLIKKNKKRLDYIGNEEVRNRYAIYTLTNQVKSRTWFENPPKQIIADITPYITLDATKKELTDLIQFMEKTEQGWGHLRTAPAPDFTFEDINGNMITLSDYRGKFVLLDVWNIYCGPCMKQVPHLKRMEPALQKMGVVVIGVSCDPQNIKDKWKATVEVKKMAGIQVIMDNGRQSKFLNDYYIPGFPTFCLINPDGYVVNPYFKLYPEMPGFIEYIQQKIDEYNSKE